MWCSGARARLQRSSRTLVLRFPGALAFARSWCCWMRSNSLRRRRPIPFPGRRRGRSRCTCGFSRKPRGPRVSSYWKPCGRRVRSPHCAARYCTCTLRKASGVRNSRHARNACSASRARPETGAPSRSCWPWRAAPNRFGALFRRVWRGGVVRRGVLARHARLAWRSHFGGFSHRLGRLLEQILERTKDGGVLVIGDLELPATEARIAALRLRFGLLRSGVRAEGYQRARAVLVTCDIHLESVEGAEQGVRRLRRRGGARLADVLGRKRTQGARNRACSARTGQLGAPGHRRHGEVGLLLPVARGAERRALGGSFFDLTHALGRQIDPRAARPPLGVGIHGEQRRSEQTL